MCCKCESVCCCLCRNLSHIKFVVDIYDHYVQTTTIAILCQCKWAEHQLDIVEDDDGLLCLAGVFFVWAVCCVLLAVEWLNCYMLHIRPVVCCTLTSINTIHSHRLHYKLNSIHYFNQHHHTAAAAHTLLFGKKIIFAFSRNLKLLQIFHFI